MDRRHRRRAVLSVSEPVERDHLFFWHDVRRELERSRRFGRAFALVRFEWVAPVSAERLGETLRRTLRDTDALLMEDRHVVAMLTEVTNDGLGAAIVRLTRASRGALSDSPVSLVRFPDDALTSVALVDRLYSCMESEQKISVPVQVSHEQARGFRCAGSVVDMTQ